MDQQQASANNSEVSKETLWYLDNYILLKDYLDRTISRIAARCIRKNNIALEEYPFYGYILDILEEISETGDYVLEHKELHPLVEKKIQGGMLNFKKNLNEYKQELKSNSTPDMIKQDSSQELEKMRNALGIVDKSTDPTAGAGMSMDEVIEKLMNKQQVSAPEGSSLAATVTQTSTPQQPRAQVDVTPQQPRPQPQTSANAMPQQPRSAEQQPSPQQQAMTSGSQQPALGQPRIIKKIVKIVKPATSENNQVVPNKVTE